VDVVVIGVSTGGPQALRSLLPAFPAEFPVPVAIVLHMPQGFTGPLAERLDKISPLQVTEASEGLELLPGRAILAQAGRHLYLQRREADIVVAHLDLLPDDLPHRPAVDVLFRSAAEVYGQRTLGIILTGMGDDGTQGSAWIKAQGGQVYGEAESSCVVFGMPRSVIEAGLSDKIIPLSKMAETIQEAV
jgi:two-component system chemotaxis response regulator CheB